MLRTLPKEVDTLLAARFFCYSTMLPELAALCLIYQCHPIWVYCLEVVGPMYKALHTAKPRDFELAEQRYLALMSSEG